MKQAASGPLTREAGRVVGREPSGLSARGLDPAGSGGWISEPGDIEAGARGLPTRGPLGCGLCVTQKHPARMHPARHLLSCPRAASGSDLGAPAGEGRGPEGQGALLGFGEAASGPALQPRP